MAKTPPVNERFVVIKWSGPFGYGQNGLVTRLWTLTRRRKSVFKNGSLSPGSIWPSETIRVSANGRSCTSVDRSFSVAGLTTIMNGWRKSRESKFILGN